MARKGLKSVGVKYFSKSEKRNSHGKKKLGTMKSGICSKQKLSAATGSIISKKEKLKGFNPQRAVMKWKVRNPAKEVAVQEMVSRTDSGW